MVKKLASRGKALGITENEIRYFYDETLRKTYSHFSSEKFLTPNQFTFDKVQFTLASAFVYGKSRNLSIGQVVDSYSYDLKYEIRAQADGVKEDGLPVIWAQDTVALFNILNAVKFSKNIFEEFSFSEKSVLDVGCSVGAASWFALSKGAKRFLVSDIDGAPLDDALNVLSYFGASKVDSVPIKVASDVPCYGDSEFDICLYLHVLEQTEDPLGLSRAMWKALKPGGALVYTYYYAPIAGGINTTAGRDNSDETLEYLRSVGSHSKKYDLNPYSFMYKSQNG